MAANYDNSNGLLPSGVLQPYGQNILKYGIGQLGTPIDVGALTPTSCRSNSIPTTSTTRHS